MANENNFDQIYQEIKTGMVDHTKDLLSDSVRSGNTPTESQYIAAMEQKYKELIADRLDYLTDTERNIIFQNINNLNKTVLINSYRISLQQTPRVVNGKLPIKVSDDFVEKNEKRQRELKTKLGKLTNQLLTDSIKTGNTPSKNQMINYLRSELGTAISQYAPNLSEQDIEYLKSFTIPWIEDECVKMYDYSLMVKPRPVNNLFPWTPQNVENLEIPEPPVESSLSSFGVSKYWKTNNSFSGTDMVCSIDIDYPDGRKVVKVIGSLQTLTYSIHQDKRPVRAIGNMNAKDYVFGQRTIAGTLIFSVFNKHWCYELMEEYRQAGQLGAAHFLMDELPPFQITISAANESGFKARLALYGVRVINEGQVMSVNDIYTENTYQFVATDIDYLTDCTGFNKPKAMYEPIIVQSTPVPAKLLPLPPAVPSNIEPSIEYPPKENEVSPVIISPIPIPERFNNMTEDQALAKIEADRKNEHAAIDARLVSGEITGDTPTQKRLMAERVKKVADLRAQADIKAVKEYFDERGESDG